MLIVGLQNGMISFILTEKQAHTASGCVSVVKDIGFNVTNGRATERTKRKLTTGYIRGMTRAGNGEDITNPHQT